MILPTICNNASYLEVQQLQTVAAHLRFGFPCSKVGLSMHT